MELMYSQEELAVMAIFDMLKPAGRARAFERARLGEYSPDNPTIKSLADKGLIKIRGGKAMQLDKKKAQAIMKDNKVPEKYKGELDNWSMQFKVREAADQDFWLTAEEVAAVCPACAEKMASLNIRRIRATVLFGVDKPEQVIEAVRNRTAAQGDKWQKLPKGWTEESRKKFWNTLTGDVKHKVTKCMKQMEGKVDDPGAFCAALADRVEGKEWRSERSAGLIEAAEEFRKADLLGAAKQLKRAKVARGSKIARADKDWIDGDPRAPKTPWGPAQYAYILQRGVTVFGTAGHGGLRVASGVAKAMLSAAALRHAESFGGAYWFEEDVAIDIPFLEVPEWYAVYARKAGSGGKMTPEQLEKSVARSFPRYMKMREEGVKHPEPGDKLVVRSEISFRSGRTVLPGTELTLLREQRGNYVVQAPEGFEFTLPGSFIQTGGVEWL